jgi:tetratricopeptide (TPR) repeat protein
MAKKMVDRAAKYKDVLTPRLRDLLSMYELVYTKDIHGLHRAIKQVLAREPNNRLWWWFLGNQYYGIDWKEAIKAFEKAHQINRDLSGVGAWPWLYSQFADAYHETGNHQQELQIAQEAVDLWPDNGVLLFGLAVAFGCVGQEVEMETVRERYLAQRIKDGFSESSILRVQALLLRYIGRYEEAEQFARNALEIDINAPNLRQLALLLIKHDINIDEGVELARQAVDLNPDWYSLDIYGWGLYKQGNYKQAVEILEKAWELLPYYEHEQYTHLLAAREAVAKD